MNQLFKLVKKRKNHIWKSDTIFWCVSDYCWCQTLFFCSLL